jgi:hypothetical protein
VIKKYERSTGQLINPAKSSLFFGSGCGEPDRGKVMQVLQVSNTIVEEKYLGLPTPEGRMSQDKFKSTKEWLVKKCSSWVEKNMSMGAKEVLIKSVAQAIPAYVMGVFKLPATTCNELTQVGRGRWAKEGSLGGMGENVVAKDKRRYGI